MPIIWVYAAVGNPKSTWSEFLRCLHSSYYPGFHISLHASGYPEGKRKLSSQCYALFLLFEFDRHKALSQGHISSLWFIWNEWEIPSPKASSEESGNFTFCILLPQGTQQYKIPRKISIKDLHPREETAQETHYRETHKAFRGERSHRLHHSQILILITNKQEYSTDKSRSSMCPDTVPVPALLFMFWLLSETAGGSRPRYAFIRKLSSANASSNSSAERDKHLVKKQASIRTKSQITETAILTHAFWTHPAHLWKIFLFISSTFKQIIWNSAWSFYTLFYSLVYCVLGWVFLCFILTVSSINPWQWLQIMFLLPLWYKYFTITVMNWKVTSTKGHTLNELEKDSSPPSAALNPLISRSKHWF